MDAALRESRDSVEFARDVLRQEAAAIVQIAEGLGDVFARSVDLLAGCRGGVVVMGIGKAGLVGQKISATLCSTGTRSYFLHPSEAIHGDLGRVSTEDVVLALSMSGETEELVRVLPPLAAIPVPIVAMTSQSTSTLGRAAHRVLELGRLAEACPLGLAPSTSTTAMLAMGDAIALTLSQRRGFRERDFARFHPGGSLGRKLTMVQELMRPLRACRVAREEQTVRETFVALRRPGRRTGAVMVVDASGRLKGIFTDTDLAKLLEQQSDTMLDAPVSLVMTHHPHSVAEDTLMPKAISILAERRISELPVVDRDHQPIGMLDITDVLGWLPGGELEETFDGEGRQDATMLPHERIEDPVTLPFPNLDRPTPPRRESTS